MREPLESIVVLSIVFIINGIFWFAISLLPKYKHKKTIWKK